MLNQKTLRKHKKHKNNSERLLLGPPKIRRIRKPKNLGETKKNKKNNSGEVLRKRGSSQESLRIGFFVFLFFLVFPRFFFFFCFSDFGGSSQESLRIVFFLFFFGFFGFPKFWGVQPRVSQNCVFSLFVFPWFLVLFVFSYVFFYPLCIFISVFWF